mmetsp:Transcript_33810/g.81982  ORF Transcript_33810/g.81982 Transcript_33810/m.81982 type:complete len:158 (-) Transcript_33810:102-575(-)|eukprot:CAMPEP_0113644262 /NCGR_PEP_ID=MMETSP0017_2-20120614/23292_1 /TAXON_ID=2856 /ORGANISM="Cylindrotheca closterium" /LENGTH=157 /DNA_ID=CAMNT_0000555857 /DNA_START=77 /DNA_END=550 /DNA_ORIENTATION=- /assembly_acc=CAM_ASM_000147
MMIHKLTALLVALFLSAPVLAFTNQRIDRSLPSMQWERTRGLSPIFSTEPENNGGLGDDIPLPESSVSPPTSNEPEGTQYPLNVPSPLLLASSMILAIVGTGSAFELVNPDPKFGFAQTAVLALFSIPTCFFLFYASVLKATAETEADDKEFMKNRY